MPTLYLMLGYPGAGKTTTAEIIARLTGAEHIASDKMRLQMFPEPTFTPEEHNTLYYALNRRTEELLAAGKDVVYDANLNRYIHRKEKYDICERIGAEVKLLWIRTPEEISKKRAIHDSRRHLWPKNEAPDEMFDRLVHVFEPPHADEPHITLDGTKINEHYIRQALEL